MARDAEQADWTAGESPAVTASAMSSFGPVCVSRSEVDIRGTSRRKPQFIISACDGDGEWSLQQPDVSALGRAIAAADANEIYIRWPRQREGGLKQLLLALEGAGFQREDFWPVLPHPGAKTDELILRVSRQQPQHPLPPARAEWARSAVAEDHHRLIAALQLEVESTAAHAILNSSFDAQHRVRRIMTVGSTSRGTYAAFPADFDLVIHTEVERTSIEHADARLVCELLLERVTQSEAFESYARAIGLSVGSPDLPCVQLQSLGVRGPQSLVARYDLVWRNTAREDRFSFLDVTFGKLPQLIGYEIWFRRFLDQLGPPWAERLRSEIRVAKAVLKRLGEVYGSANHGLRAHAVEQWIIQSFSYRAPGIPVGTLDNALRLIFEEGAAATPSGAVAPIRFEEFKARFPLWHPGWWECEGGFGRGRRNVNLWDLLGDGDLSAAEHKWLKLVALGLAYERSEKRPESWNIESLARSAEAMLPLIKGAQNTIGS
jgi:hypothetical protein